MTTLAITLVYLGSLGMFIGTDNDPALTGRINALVQPYIESGDFMGTILVARGNAVVFENSYGSAVVEHDIDNAAGTLFRIGSITKQFTAAAILLLEADGRLNVEDSLEKYVPEYKYADKVTLHQLLSHRAGVPNYVDFTDYEIKRRQWLSDAELIEWLGAQPLAFEPGSNYGYSNSGYVLLRMVIKRVSGMRYAEFLQQRIFGPTEMQTARIEERGEIVPGLASGYNPGPGRYKMVKAPNVAEALDLGASGIVASVRDMLQWHRAIQNNLVLPSVQKEKMETSYGNAYGYGVSIHKLHGHRAISHDGRTDGYTTYFIRFPADDTVVIVFSNVATIVRDYITSGVTAAVFDAEYEPTPAAKVVEEAVVDLDGLSGTYKFPPNWWFRIHVENGHAYLSWMGREPTYLSPLENGDFFMRLRYERLSFPLNEDGICTEALYYWNDNPVKCPRIEN